MSNRKLPHNVAASRLSQARAASADLTQAADTLALLDWSNSTLGREGCAELCHQLRQAARTLALPPAPRPYEVVSKVDHMVALTVLPYEPNDPADGYCGAIVIGNSRGRSCVMSPAQAREMADKLNELVAWSEAVQ